MVALECDKGFLQVETLDRAVASLKRLRATALGCPEDYLQPLKTRISTPRPPMKNDPDELNNYFVYMRRYLEDLMKGVIILLGLHARTSFDPSG